VGISCPAFSYIAGNACVPFPAFSDATLFVEGDATISADAGIDDSAPADDVPPEASPPADADAGTFDLVCDAGVPIPECVEYFMLFSACTGRDFLAGACQSAGETDASVRAASQQLCIANIQRIQQACR
jgi:hypothetical protein